MSKENKTTQLQIRLGPKQRKTIHHLARKTGMTVSQWVLERILPGDGQEFQRLVGEIGRTKDCLDPYLFAGLGDFLCNLKKENFSGAVAEPPENFLAPISANIVAAMVEEASLRNGVRAPLWTREVRPLAKPYFASSLRSLRPHLLKESPPCYRKRNLFVDASIEDRL